MQILHTAHKIVAVLVFLAVEYHIVPLDFASKIGIPAVLLRLAADWGKCAVGKEASVLEIITVVKLSQ